MRTETTSMLQPGLHEFVLSSYDAFVSRLNGSQPEVTALRSAAFEAFKSLGIPTNKLEAWKYTQVEKHLSAPLQMFSSIQETDLDVSVPKMDGLHFEAVSVNGVFRKDLSTLPDDDDAVVVCGLRQALDSYPEMTRAHLAELAAFENDAFTALNTAFIGDGLFVWIKRGHTLSRPLLIRDVQSVGNRTLIQPRNLFIFEERTTASLVEWYQSFPGTNHLENTVSEIRVGKAARINHLHLYDRGDRADLINSLFVHQDADSQFSTNHVTLSGALVRHNLNFLPDAEGCETHLLGLILARGDMHVDVHSFVDHAKPNAFSNELYKCILDDRAVGVFNGKVMVRQDAQLINAYQSNRSVLLSDTAHMYSKPELEIYADDVKCSHGATTGQLDEDAIFYLRSRGLTYEAARLLLLESFAMEVIEKITEPSIQHLILSRIRQLLSTNDS